MISESEIIQLRERLAQAERELKQSIDNNAKLATAFWDNEDRIKQLQDELSTTEEQRDSFRAEAEALRKEGVLDAQKIDALKRWLWYWRTQLPKDSAHEVDLIIEGKLI